MRNNNYDNITPVDICSDKLAGLVSALTIVIMTLFYFTLYHYIKVHYGVHGFILLPLYFILIYFPFRKNAIYIGFLIKKKGKVLSITNHSIETLDIVIPYDNIEAIKIAPKYKGFKHLIYNYYVLKVRTDDGTVYVINLFNFTNPKDLNYVLEDIDFPFEVIPYKEDTK